jgi:hypothetical protein
MDSVSIPAQPAQFGTISRASNHLWTPEPTQDRIYKPNTNTSKPLAGVTANITEVYIHEAMHLRPCIIIQWPESIQDTIKRESSTKE